MNKKTLAKANFCSNTVYSHYFKFRAKIFHAAKPLAFSLHFLFRRDRNHYSNLTSKIMKMCEQILKKKTPPQYNSNSLNCKKNHDVPNNSRYRFAATNKNHSLVAPLFTFVQHQNFFTPFISRFKNHSNKIDLKKDFSNTRLRDVIKRNSPILLFES